MELYDLNGNPQYPPWLENTFDTSVQCAVDSPKFQLRVLMERGPSLVSVYSDIGDIGPVEGAECAFARDGHPLVIGATDGSGHCNVTLGPGRYRVWVEHGEYESDKIVDLPIQYGRRLRAIFYLVGDATTEPEPEPAPEEETMKVYDFDHGIGGPIYHDFDWLKTIFGPRIAIHPASDKATLQPGALYWKIVWLNCKVGDTSCLIHTQDQAGDPLPEVKTVFHWPSAEPFVEQGLAELPHGWTTNGAVGPTNAEGDAGPGYGQDAYYDAATEEGPHLVWIYDTIPAECITGLGMLTWHDDVEGNHLHFDIGYQLAVWEGEEPDPGPDPDPDPTPDPIDGSVADYLDELEADLLGLSTDVALEKISAIRSLLWG